VSWEREDASRNHNAWAIPKSEVTIHEETVAVEDLNIYPENLSLLPTLIQHGQENWQLQSVNLNTDWTQDSNFYAAADSWIDGFYARPDGWTDGFYAVLGGWIRDHGFYAVPGGWIGGFYSILGGWIEDLNFYVPPGGWIDGFYTALAGWLDGFYATPGGWYIGGENI
jgi:hypothetical protein